MFGHFCGLDNVPIFSVYTRLGRGVVSVLVHHGHIADLSDGL